MGFAPASFTCSMSTTMSQCLRSCAPTTPCSFRNFTTVIVSSSPNFALIALCSGSASSGMAVAFAFSRKPGFSGRRSSADLERKGAAPPRVGAGRCLPVGASSMENVAALRLRPRLNAASLRWWMGLSGMMASITAGVRRRRWCGSETPFARISASYSTNPCSTRRTERLSISDADCDPVAEGAGEGSVLREGLTPAGRAL
mmetsp:Transcript_32371/g.64558  ORF Transcript_32371/g.64558 Transcript_32371/m.64558 type:complete len:201 (-) Transcript_32371:89-691(-)